MALAPTREFARPVLGTVGEATAEIIEESGGQISPGDVVGLSGLQEQYDEQLRGQLGIAVEVVPADGDPDVVFERDVIAQWCNTALIDQRGAVTRADLADAAASLGLGLDHDLRVPAFGGLVPAEAGSTEHAASMIGQGKVLASPLAMATVAASVAAGQTVSPRIVEGTAAAPSGDAAPLTDDESNQLQAMMRAAVESGSATFLGDVPGEPVGAKTGTAEYGSDDPPRTHGWMIAIQGDLAVAVLVQDAESGSHTAGPLLKEFIVDA